MFLKLLIIKLNDNEVDLVLQMGNMRVENTESNIYPFSHYVDGTCVEVKPDNNDIKPEPEVQHFCDQCDHKTMRKGNLKRHVEAQHEGLYYSCDQCDYKAKQKGQIKQHVKANVITKLHVRVIGINM